MHKVSRLIPTQLIHADRLIIATNRGPVEYYLSQENFQAAAVEFRKIADLDSDKAGAWFKLGHEYLDLAARLAYRGARLYPESAWGHRFLGDILLQRNRGEDAVQEYRKALAVAPLQSGLHTLLGEAYSHTGKLEEAEKEFRLDLQLAVPEARGHADGVARDFAEGVVVGVLRVVLPGVVDRVHVVPVAGPRADEEPVGPGWQALLRWYGVLCEHLRVARGYGDWEDLFLQVVVTP